jgi:hypothetical protein
MYTVPQISKTLKIAFSGMSSGFINSLSNAIIRPIDKIRLITSPIFDLLDYNMGLGASNFGDSYSTSVVVDS